MLSSRLSMLQKPSVVSSLARRHVQYHLQQKQEGGSILFRSNPHNVRNNVVVGATKKTKSTMVAGVDSATGSVLVQKNKSLLLKRLTATSGMIGFVGYQGHTMHSAKKEWQKSATALNELIPIIKLVKSGDGTDVISYRPKANNDLTWYDVGRSYYSFGKVVLPDMISNALSKPFLNANHYREEVFAVATKKSIDKTNNDSHVLDQIKITSWLQLKGVLSFNNVIWDDVVSVLKVIQFKGTPFEKVQRTIVVRIKTNNVDGKQSNNNSSSSNYSSRPAATDDDDASSWSATATNNVDELLLQEGDNDEKREHRRMKKILQQRRDQKDFTKYLSAFALSVQAEDLVRQQQQQTSEEAGIYYYHKHIFDCHFNLAKENFEKNRQQPETIDNSNKRMMWSWKMTATTGTAVVAATAALVTLVARHRKLFN